MKTTIFYTSLITGLLLTTGALAAQKSGGGGAGGSAGAAAAPAAPAAPRTGIVTPKKPSPGVPGGPAIVTPIGQAGQPAVQQPTDQSTQTAATNNNFSAATNRFAGTNNNNPADMGNNPSSVTPAVNPATNGFVNVNSNVNINGNSVSGDQTVTSSDRILLTTLSQGARGTLGITPNGNLPVHFMINNGTVTVVGTVQSSAQSQGVMSQVQQTPGVLGVVNDLHVASATTAQGQLASPNSVFATPTDHAFSPRDRTLLTTVQQQAAVQLGVNTSAQMPVHFSIQNGVVGVTGQAASLQEKQALIAALSRTPGVVRVVDNVVVPGGTVGTGMRNTSGFSTSVGGNNNLPATSRPIGSNTIFLNSNNASGF